MTIFEQKLVLASLCQLPEVDVYHDPLGNVCFPVAGAQQAWGALKAETGAESEQCWAIEDAAPSSSLPLPGDTMATTMMASYVGWGCRAGI